MTRLNRPSVRYSVSYCGILKLLLLFAGVSKKNKLLAEVLQHYTCDRTEVFEFIYLIIMSFDED